MAVTRARVLLIDPQDEFRNSLSIKLRQDGYLVASERNSREGYARALESPPDVVLLEMDMPDGDGATALQQFRANPRLCRIPMIVLTDDAREASVRRALELGARDYILKQETSIDLLLRRLRLLHGLFGRSTTVPSPLSEFDLQP